MTKFKGIVFDFNGTIIVDDDYHYLGWVRYAKELGLEMSEDFYYKNMHGSTNNLIWSLFYDGEIPPEQQGVFGQPKEVYYREQFKENPPPSAKGFLELLSFLKENKIPHAIATSSEISNVEFFDEIFHIYDMFDGNVVYDDGTVRGKPQPDLYLKAAAMLGLDPSDVVTVEDSYSGALACKAAGSGMVIGICPRGKELFRGRENTDLVITDFTELDYKNLF